MESFNRDNNPLDNWIGELRERVNSIETELPNGSFDSVMNTIKRKRGAKVVKLICYSAAAAIVIAAIPTVYIATDNEPGSVAHNNTEHIAVISKPSENLYIAQDNSSKSSIKDGTNIKSVSAKHLSVMAVNSINYDTADESGSQGLLNTVTSDKAKTLENVERESAIIEKSLEESDEIKDNTVNEDYTAVNTEAEQNLQRDINLTFSDQAEWDKAGEISGNKGRKGKRHGKGEGLSIAFNAGNAAGGGMFLDTDYANNMGDYDSNYSMNSMIEGVNKVGERVDNSALSAVENGLSHITGVMENKLDLTGGSYNHKLPLRFGVTVAVPVSENLYFETGVSYSYLRSDIKKGREKISQKLHYIGVPANFNWYFVNNSHAGLYLGAGCRINRCIGASIANERFSINRFEPSVNIQAGFLGKLSRSVGIYLQPGISFNFSKERLATFNDFAVQNYYSDKDFSVTFDGGLRFSF